MKLVNSLALGFGIVFGGSALAFGLVALMAIHPIIFSFLALSAVSVLVGLMLDGRI